MSARQIRTVLRYVLMFLLAFGTHAVSGNNNLIPNPSFEDPSGRDRPVSGWVFVPFTAKGQKPSTGVYLNDEVTGQKQSHTGQCCVMSEGVAGGACAWLSPSIKCKSHTDYKLTAWVKGEDNAGGGASITVQTFDVAGKVGPPCGLPVRLSLDWQQVEMGFISEPDATCFRIDLNSGGVGKVWFDDISLVEDTEGRSLSKVNALHFSFEGEKAMEGWSKTQGATVTPSGDHLQIQGADWNSLIYRSINLRASKYRLSGSGMGQVMVYVAKDWSGKRLTMVNLSGGDFRSDEQTFDFPGGQLLLVVQVWSAKGLANIQSVDIALDTLARSSTDKKAAVVNESRVADRTAADQFIAAVMRRYEALKKLEGTTPVPAAGAARERGAALIRPNAVIPILYPVNIEIDGNTKNWSAVPFTGTLSVNCEGFPPPANAADAGATFKIAASDKMLALLILVQDDKLVFSNPSAVCWNDTIEIFLDPLFTRSDRHDDTSMQLFITYKDQTMKELVVSGRIPLIAKPVSVEGGWGVEISIPLDNRIFQLHPFDGLPIGVNVSYNDNDQGEGRERKITWSALDTGDFSWMRTDVFGTGVFVGDVSMPVVPPTPSEAVMKAKRLRAPVESFTDVAVLARERPSPSVVRGFQSGTCSPKLFSEMKQWGANIVRVQMQGLKSYSSLKDKSDLMKEENMKAYLDELEGIVKDARTAGMKLLLANHGVVRPPNIAGNIADSANNINQKMYEFWEHPELEKMFCFFWKSVAERLLPYRDTIWAYDLMNEPYDPNQMPFGPKQWPPLAVKAIKAIRSVDKDSWIDYEVGPGGMPSGFRDLTPLPDSHIIYDFHMYVPHAFTHQGLPGYGDEGYGSEEKKVHYPGMIGGIPFDKDYLRKCMQPAIDFQKKWKVPINVGEFSVIAWAPPESASAYLADIISIFEENGWSWEYHAYAEFQGWSLVYEDGFYWRHWKNEQPKLAKTETVRGKVLREALRKNGAAINATDEKTHAGNSLSLDDGKPEFPIYSKPDSAVGPDAFKILIVGNSISGGMAATSE